MKKGRPRPSRKYLSTGLGDYAVRSGRRMRTQASLDWPGSGLEAMVRQDTVSGGWRHHGTHENPLARRRPKRSQGLGSLEERFERKALFLEDIAQPAQCVHLDLAHALARDTKLLGHAL